MRTHTHVQCLLGSCTCNKRRLQESSLVRRFIARTRTLLLLFYYNSNINVYVWYFISVPASNMFTYSGSSSSSGKCVVQICFSYAPCCLVASSHLYFAFIFCNALFAMFGYRCSFFIDSHEDGVYQVRDACSAINSGTNDFSTGFSFHLFLLIFLIFLNFLNDGYLSIRYDFRVIFFTRIIPA